MKNYLMRLRAFCFLFAHLFLSGSCVSANQIKLFDFTILVEDSDKQPVADAKLIVTTMKNAHDESYVILSTGPDGRAVIKTKGIGYFFINVSKDNYYTVLLEPALKYDDTNFWLPPDAEYTVTLERKENPKPMYVHEVDWVDIPVVGEDVGFDLFKGDWVSPHGKGIKADLVFHVTRKFNNISDYESTMVVKSAGESTGVLPVPPQGGGITYMDLALGKKAPEKGYQPTWKRRVGKKPGNPYVQYLNDPPQKEISKLPGYWIRVRETEAGVHYGKIVGAIQVTPRSSETAKIHFLYYVAAEPNDRNLEWDLETSLVPNAKIPNRRRH